MSGITAAQAAELSEGVGNVGVGAEQWSQASTRTYAVFTDQWDREWGADIEHRTQHPCGPLAARFRAPIYPPQKYIVITNTMRRLVRIDLHQWIRDLQEAALQWSQYRDRMAMSMFGAKAHEAISDAEGNMHPALINVIGRRPMPIEVVQAMIHGNKWALGLKNPDGSSPTKPAKAPRDYFPDVEQLRARDPFALEHDPWAEEQGGGQAAVVGSYVNYPHNFAPGKWFLSAEHQVAYEAGEAPAFQGKKVDALEAIKNGQVPAHEPVADPAWED